MQKRQKRRILVLLTAVTTLGLVAPILFGTPRQHDGTGGDPWRNTIFDFQTLIAGAMAVGAAYATLRQMQKSDLKSDIRHDQLVRLTRRQEALQLERALYPRLSTVRRCRKEIKNISDAFPTDPSEFNEEIKQRLSSTIEVTREVIPKIEPLRDDDIAKLFGGRLTRDIGELLTACRHLQSYSTKALIHDNRAKKYQLGFERTGDPQKAASARLSRQESIEHIMMTATALVAIDAKFDAFFKEVGKLVELYQLRLDFG